MNRILARASCRSLSGLVCLMICSLCFLPGSASAQLGDDIAAAIQEVIGNLQGTELLNPTYETDFMGQHFVITLVGFALCEPSNPWAEPNLTPEPPFNSYGCENVSDVDVTVAPSETSADVGIAVDHLFVDFTLERDWGICIPLTPCDECIGSGSPVTSDGYLLGGASLTLTLALEEVGSCTEVAIDPGSVEITLNDPVIALQGDACLASLMSTFGPAVMPMLEEALSAGLEELLIASTAEINDIICTATPARPSSWGGLKSVFRGQQPGSAE
jgi:hypothetical protein